MRNKDISEFIKAKITKREKSFFANDSNFFADDLQRNIANKNVLVIGGAGTIGSYYIKELLKYNPKALTIVDHNENGLTELTRDLRSNNKIVVPEIYLTYPISFGGKVFKKLLDKNHYDIIACFAAHKHVRSEKDYLAIEAMIVNNVISTRNLLEQIKDNPPDHFFSVSTDKATNPVSVMGASKKLMEIVLLAYSELIPIKTARFANVAFSNGSLLDGFIHRLNNNQPLSAPTDVKRYFVSPEEAGELCLLASIIGESKDIFFPKLKSDQMLSFSEIGESFLHMNELEPDFCDSEENAKLKAEIFKKGDRFYPVHFTKSNTSGEKMFEEFFTDKDLVDSSTFEGLSIIKNTTIKSLDLVDEIIHDLNTLFDKDNIDKNDIVKLLVEYIPTFSHSEKGKSLDSKM